MKAYVLDTHAFVWWTTKPGKLGRAAKRALFAVDRGKAEALVPSIVGVELALIAEAGRRVPTPADLQAATRRNSSVRVLLQDLGQVLEFAVLPALADPFDRMVVAAARAAKLPLITADTTIADSALVDVVWD